MSYYTTNFALFYRKFIQHLMSSNSVHSINHSSCSIPEPQAGYGNLQSRVHREEESATEDRLHNHVIGCI